MVQPSSFPTRVESTSTAFASSQPAGATALRQTRTIAANASMADSSRLIPPLGKGISGELDPAHVREMRQTEFPQPLHASEKARAWASIPEPGARVPACVSSSARRPSFDAEVNLDGRLRTERIKAAITMLCPKVLIATEPLSWLVAARSWDQVCWAI